jgi:hypothetical protein
MGGPTLSRRLRRLIDGPKEKNMLTYDKFINCC